MRIPMRTCAIMMLAAALRLCAQDSAQDPVQPEKWNLYFQATSIGQYHGSFNSPYSGTFSLAGHPEAEKRRSLPRVLRMAIGSQHAIYFDPEFGRRPGL